MGKTQSPVDRIRNVSVYIISGMAVIAWRNAEYKVLPITEDMQGGMGVAILLGIVAVAVAIFIIKGAHKERFCSFETQHIVAEEEVRKMVLEEKQEFAPLSRKCTVTGVILSIVSVVPMMLMAAFSMPDIYYIYSLAVLLIFVAIATFFLCVVRNNHRKLPDFAGGRGLQREK